MRHLPGHWGVSGLGAHPAGHVRPVRGPVTGGTGPDTPSPLPARPLASQPVKILAYVHRYPPLHNAGAEWMLHHTLKWMLNHGHEVRVLTSLPATDLFDGVLVTARPNSRTVRRWAAWADVMVTHLDVTRFAVTTAVQARKPLVHLVHNHRQLAYHRVPASGAQLAVFNSQHLANIVEWPGPQMVLYPPVPPDSYPPAKKLGDRVLFSNATGAKGADLVYALAEAMPDVGWTVVAGAYGVQMPPPPHLENVEVVAQRPDFPTLLAEAGLVVMPSSYETWGRVAVEGAVMGVPSVVADLPGMREAGVAAAYLHVDADPSGHVGGRAVDHVQATDRTMRAWERAIRSNLGSVKAGQRARHRALELWATTEGQLADLETRMGALI